MKSIEGSAHEDRECLAISCVWDGSAASAEFWHLLNASYHCAGRGSEVSLASPKDYLVKDVNKCVCEHQVLCLELQKQKGGALQDVAIHPFRNGLLQDCHFSAVCLVAMVGCNHEFVFPNFSEAALATTKSGKSTSKVPPLWKSLFEDVSTKCNCMLDKMNKNLTSHC